MRFSEFRKKYLFKPPEHYPSNADTKPVVSICVQTFNHERYIKKCLYSLLNQTTSFKYEILIGEDNSTDDTRRICIDFAEMYPDKIRLILHHDENKISINNLTTGNFNAIYNFYQVKGEYVAFCEGDDFWNDQSKLEKQIDFLRKNGTFSFCYHSFTEKFDNGFNIKEYLNQPRKDLKKKDLKELKAHPQLSTMCFRKNKSLFQCEMAEVINVDSFLISLLGNFGPAKYLAEIHPNVYRRHSGGIWSNRSRINKLELKKNTFQKLKDFYNRLEKRETADAFEDKIENINKSLFILNLKSLKIKAALDNLKDIISVG